MFVDGPEEITDKLRDKVLLAFLPPGGDLGPYIMSFSYGNSGAKALLLAMPNNDVVLDELEDRPTIMLDYELGTTVYQYIRSTRYILYILIFFVYILESSLIIYFTAQKIYIYIYLFA